MSAGIAETGTETSCLRLAPWRRCASGTDSRNFHMACACAIEVASIASSMVPRCGGFLERARSEEPLRSCRGFGEVSSISKYQGVF